ncbi:MAG: bifunctional (p)ppGpp synthetase/guanosine-3',5'-bis(diphosphate) 3'-pyrophosphohydrolase [Proteobacteria bacterium]|jgi:RelA/SpoT family (p)ppGpp synthetase|nr:bifunctional (p)ppGpp synthetase/guanosine-3',5'-bis(diphosphate) 3'-pyrophosphohydrolase [Alphaproteobacteria bacterium]NBV93271.1 bifunctional (p)ppGpp synthetase/guanosine-3',5'-bis(diphosphate) 3'-pyrophosphohydrolase [Candidatus Fonsibacter sp. PEL4]
MLNQQEFLDKVKVYNNYIDENVVKKAYNFAFDVHKNQKRLSGDPYITHPIAVASILCDLKVDTATITTALLHDTIEDTEATYSEVNKLFGKEIADLVEGVTKISRLEDKSKEYSVAENFRKLILATSKDIRVLLVKLADRLHNMRTINNITNPDKKLRIAKETMEIYSPLAERMGMHNFRDELEDLAFNVLNPEARKLITDRLILNKEILGVTFSDISKKILKLLEEKDIKAKVTGREKTPFSIWRKIQGKRISLEQITDIVGFRIILDSVDTCYRTLGIFHTEWSMVPGRFKDYISVPKSNNYKSIHTSVIGPKRQKIEIQIRTHEMHEFAERGVAAHWNYKSNEKVSHNTLKDYNWLKDLVEMLESGENPEHFFEYTKLQLFQDQVFCFTPKGALIRLPANATPIDFAYAVHTEIGDKCIGCKINGKESPLQSILQNGDEVQITTSSKPSPSMYWSAIAKTGKARAAVRRYWNLRKTEKKYDEKTYDTSLWVLLSHKAGTLGEVCTLIGKHKCNISNVELVDKKDDFISFIFDLEIKNLKDFTNLVSEIKQQGINFKIIRNRKANVDRKKN